jgi:hypothetical protein
VVRVHEIIDPVLRRRVIDALAERQGIRPEDLPHWYEMDDASYSELLLELNEAEDVDAVAPPEDPRE